MRKGGADRAARLNRARASGGRFMRQLMNSGKNDIDHFFGKVELPQ
jgi:hypothetical protein